MFEIGATRSRLQDFLLDRHVETIVSILFGLKIYSPRVLVSFFFFPRIEFIRNQLLGTVPAFSYSYAVLFVKNLPCNESNFIRTRGTFRLSRCYRAVFYDKCYVRLQDVDLFFQRTFDVSF